jgi:hypothetical protein
MMLNSTQHASVESLCVEGSLLSANKRLYSLCMAKKSQMFIVCFDVVITVKTFKKFFVHFVQCVLFLTLTQFVL